MGGVRERRISAAQSTPNRTQLHRRVHQRFNDHLVRQGLVNSWEVRILSRRPLLASLDVRNWLAVTAATEHLTAVFAEFMLAHPHALHGAEARLRDMWPA